MTYFKRDTEVTFKVCITLLKSTWHEVLSDKTDFLTADDITFTG